MMAGMASLGLPGFSGFVAEMTIFFGAFAHNDLFHRIFTIIACTSIVITAVYILRVVGKILFGPAHSDAALHLSDALWHEKLPVLILLTCIIAIGVAPLALSDLIRQSVVPMLAPHFSF